MTIRPVIGAVVATAAVSAALTVATAGAAHAADPFPPMGCGMTRAEIGPLSSAVHGLEATLLSLNLAGPVHGLNCSVVIDVERLVGLQSTPTFP